MPHCNRASERLTPNGASFALPKAGKDPRISAQIPNAMNKFLLVPFLTALSSAPLFAGAGTGPWALGAYYPGQLDGRYFASVYNNVDGSFSKVSTTNSYYVTNQTVTTEITNSGGLIVTNTVTTNVVTGPLFETNTVVTGSVISGILGFGIKDGVPTVVGASGSTEGGAGAGNASVGSFQVPSFDPTLNNFVIYVNGDVYVGTTAASINPSSSTVAGALINGAGRARYQVFTNQEAGVASVANVGVQVISLPSATASGYFNANVKNNKSPYTFKGKGTISIATASGASSFIDGIHQFNLNGIKTSLISASAVQQNTQAATPR